jgi:hypothetical protein
VCREREREREREGERERERARERSMASQSHLFAWTLRTKLENCGILLVHTTLESCVDSSDATGSLFYFNTYHTRENIIYTYDDIKEEYTLCWQKKFSNKIILVISVTR